jgi:Uncharacterised nucleotidyltransferase
VELSPERRLLIACARSKLASADRQRIAELAGAALNWDQFGRVSYAHGIAPLIYHSFLRSDALRFIPPAAAQSLQRSYYVNAVRNSLLYNELREILTTFNDQRIEVIVLKGAALAEIVYPHRALRPMSDIDLFVRNEKLAEVETKLLNMGYVLNEREKTKDYWQKHHYHLVFENGSGIPVEIHWHIKRPTDSFQIDIDDLWERSQPIKIADVGAFVFSAEDLLLYLCQHFWKHRLAGGIRPVCDIAEAAIYYRDKIKWERVASISAEWEMNSCSYLGLWLARELLDAPIPEEFLRDLRPMNFNMEVISWAREAILGYGECPRVFPDLVRLFWKGCSARERWAILQKVLSRKTVAGYVKDASASKGACLYYPLRMKHLLTRYGPTVARLWARDQRVRAAVETEEKHQRLTKWLSQA